MLISNFSDDIPDDPDIGISDEREPIPTRQELFEIRRGRSQSLSAVPRDNEGSAFFPPGSSVSEEDNINFAKVSYVV